MDLRQFYRDLFSVCSKGDYHSVQQTILKETIDVNNMEDMGDRLLHIVVRYQHDGWQGMCSWLLNHGANVNLTNSRGQTPLQELLEVRNMAKNAKRKAEAEDALNTYLSIIQLVNPAPQQTSLQDKTPPEVKQKQLEEEKTLLLIRAYQTADFYPLEQKKLREGMLQMLQPDGAWKKCYFVLYRDTLAYFNLEDKNRRELLPKGIIVLECITEITRLRDQETKEEIQEMDVEPTNTLDAEMRDVQTEPTSPRSTKAPFEIRTSLRHYTLRAKHEEAMNDWLNIIFTLQPALRKSLTREEEVLDGVPCPLEKYLTYTLDKNMKVFKWKKQSIVIGRSNKADLSILDTKLSRNHARIEVNTKGVPVLYDLGSLGGSFVNGRKVVKCALNPSDTIQLGNTSFTFNPPGIL